MCVFVCQKLYCFAAAVLIIQLVSSDLKNRSDISIIQSLYSFLVSVIYLMCQEELVLLLSQWKQLQNHQKETIHKNIVSFLCFVYHMTDYSALKTNISQDYS